MRYKKVSNIYSRPIFQAVLSGIDEEDEKDVLKAIIIYLSIGLVAVTVWHLYSMTKIMHLLYV